MDNAARLIVNTLAQNIRTILNILLSLCATRMAMDYLGHSDYGIFMLVAGIVSLLSYMSNTLVITTQRYISYNIGAGNYDKVKLVFSNSYILHWIIGTSLVVIFASLTSLIFNTHALNIPVEKILETKIVYLFVLLSVLFTFLTAPFRALLISHENIVYISIIDTIDGILRLCLVFLLQLADSWRLPLYALIMTSVVGFHLIALVVYSMLKYEEACICIHLRDWNNHIQKQLLGFATWTLYGMSCIYVRAQGLAVILNRISNTVTNASYGIGTQVFGSVQFLSQAILNAISPQINKSEGEGRRDKTIQLALLACKYCTLLLSFAIIPLCFELPTILQLWLKDVPPNTCLFCRMMLIASLCDQLTVGLGTACQAIGKIRFYTLIVFSIKVLTIPAVYLCLKFGYPMTTVMHTYIIFEILSAITRIPIMHKIGGLELSTYIYEVIYRCICPIVFITIICQLTNIFMPEVPYRIALTVLGTLSLGIPLVFFTSMNQIERNKIIQIIKKII